MLPPHDGFRNKNETKIEYVYLNFRVILSINVLLPCGAPETKTNDYSLNPEQDTEHVLICSIIAAIRNKSDASDLQTSLWQNTYINIPYALWFTAALSSWLCKAIAGL